MKSEITYAELCQIIAEIGEYSYTADIENIMNESAILTASHCHCPESVSATW